MSRICLDTSAYSHFKRGDAAAVRALDRAKTVIVPAVVLGELRVGFATGARQAKNEGELQLFLAQPAVTTADIDDEAATLYAELVCDLRLAGTPLPTNDVWIAAVALREGATVVTYDEHFQKIPRVGSNVLARSS